MLSILTDSACGLTVSKLKEMGIYSMSLQVIQEGASHRDLEDITSKEVIEGLDKGLRLSTSQPVLDETYQVFEQMKNDQVEEVIAINICKTISGTINQLQLVNQDFGFKIHYIDLYSTYKIQTHIILMAKKYLNEGLSASEIVSKLNDLIKTTNTYLFVDDLNQLIKGGRLGTVSGKVAELLKIKPILSISKSTDGKIEVFKKVRSSKKALTAVIEELLTKVDDSYTVYVLSEYKDEEANQVEEALKNAFPNIKIVREGISSVFLAHTGKDVLVIQYIKDKTLY